MSLTQVWHGMNISTIGDANDAVPLFLSLNACFAAYNTILMSIAVVPPPRTLISLIIFLIPTVRHQVTLGQFICLTHLYSAFIHPLECRRHTVG